MRGKIKHLIKRVATSTGIVSLASRCRSPSVTVLRYHSIQDDPERLDHIIGEGITHATDVFAQQMETIARDFNPVTINDVLAFARGEVLLPKRSVAVTFDDGYADNFRIAAPIMERYGIRAAIYITVEAAEKRGLPWFCRLKSAFAETSAATWQDRQNDITHRLANAHERAAAFRRAAELCARQAGDEQSQVIDRIEHELGVAPPVPSERIMLEADEMRKLIESGHLIGSHTLTHPNLAHIGAEQLECELQESKSRLEHALEQRVCHFSYPSPVLEPHWNSETIKACQEAGYETAVTCTPGVVHRYGDPLTICRIGVPESLVEFVWAIETNICRSLRWVRTRP